MGEIYDQFLKDLDAWKTRYAGNPKAELNYLLLLALEREAIVAVAYRDDLLVKRIAAMPVKPEIQELLRHALIWAWKDEEMHAIYIRGEIFKRGNLALRARALTRQMIGLTGGWAGSVKQHLTWRSAPLSTIAASIFTWFGIITKQVPPEVVQYLRNGSFKEFCLFNIDAEKTAWLSYERLAEVLDNLPDVPSAISDDFRHIQDDELRHTQLFEILADAFQPDDHLIAGETVETLSKKIGAIGDVFLPPTLRHGIADNSTGKGGTVQVQQAAADADKITAFRRLLDESPLRVLVQQKAVSLGKPVEALKVVIKPDFMMGYHRRDLSPIVDPDFVNELARYLHETGCRDIAVVETCNLYDQFFQHRSVQEVADYFNFTSPYYRIVDLSAEQMPYKYFRGLAQYSVGRSWAEADLRISFGKLASHPTDMVDLTLNNLEGIGARVDEFVFTERKAHRDTAIMMLLNDFPVHFSLLDAYTAPDGVVGVMAAPKPKQVRRFYAGTDPLSVDVVASRHMGISSPYRANMLRTACYWFGDPSPEIEVVGVDEPIQGWRSVYHSEWSTFLSLLAAPVYEFASGRGALFVAEMDQVQFPPIKRESLPLRLARKAVQILLGIHHWRN
jgi:hypothetical protein